MIQPLKAASEAAGRRVTILGDLAGPKVRVGKIHGEHVELSSGREVTLTSDEIAGTAELISISHPKLPEEGMVGDSILLADGAIEMVVRQTSAPTIRCQVLVGGVLSSHKGVNGPSRALSMPALTDKDREEALFGVRHGMDLLALSFVREATDLLALQELLQAAGRTVPVIPKIEKGQAIDNLEAISHAADGVMVARGDLGACRTLERGVSPLMLDH